MAQWSIDTSVPRSRRDTAGAKSVLVPSVSPQAAAGRQPHAPHPSGGRPEKGGERRQSAQERRLRERRARLHLPEGLLQGHDAQEQGRNLTTFTTCVQIIIQIEQKFVSGCTIY